MLRFRVFPVVRNGAHLPISYGVTHGSSAGAGWCVLEPDDPSWTRFVERHPAAHAVHHPAWSATLAAVYGFPARSVALVDGTGAVVGGLPILVVGSRIRGRRWVSLPFTDYCPPLASAEQIPALVDAVQAAARAEGVSRIEVRGPFGSAPTRADQYRHVIPLEGGVDQVLSRCAGATRRSNKQAAAVGFAYSTGTDPADVDTFYRLHLATRRRQGVPVQPRRLFDRVAEALATHDLGFIATGRLDGAPAVAAVVLVHRDVVFIKWTASDTRAWKHRPNNGLYSWLIQWACDRGLSAFDFGRTEIGHDSLRRFKLGWGADEEIIQYSYLPEASARAPGTSSFAGRALAGAVRRGPPLICELTGRVLYRFAA